MTEPEITEVSETVTYEVDPSESADGATPDAAYGDTPYEVTETTEVEFSKDS